MSRLLCVAADKNIEATLSTLLECRQPALGVSSFSFRVVVHPRRDPGCFRDGPDFLNGLLSSGDDRGLLVFDQAWEGNPYATAAETANAIRERFVSLGIAGQAEVVVIEPEIEAWVWNTSPHVSKVLRWDDTRSPLREWLAERDLWPMELPKPPDPKAAMEAVLRVRHIPRSSSLYRELARKVGLKSCQDEAFQHLRNVLRRWFPPDYPC